MNTPLDHARRLALEHDLARARAAQLRNEAIAAWIDAAARGIVRVVRAARGRIPAPRVHRPVPPRTANG